MDILSSREALGRVRQEFQEAFDRETSNLASHAFAEQVRFNVHQAAFAEHFAQRAPVAWDDLVFLGPVASEWFVHRYALALGASDGQTIVKFTEARRFLDFVVQRWCRKYMIDVAWVRSMALMTLRAIAFHTVFSEGMPNTLLHSTFPTLVIDGDTVELVHSEFSVSPWSTVVVNPDLGPLEWNTLRETRAQFRSRVLKSITEELDAQLDRVDTPVLPADFDVKWHWMDMTIDRYAGGRSKRSIAAAHKVSRPTVDKAVEAVRTILGFPELPETWGATPIKKW